MTNNGSPQTGRLPIALAITLTSLGIAYFLIGVDFWRTTSPVGSSPLLPDAKDSAIAWRFYSVALMAMPVVLVASLVGILKLKTWGYSAAALFTAPGLVGPLHYTLIFGIYGQEIPLLAVLVLSLVSLVLLSLSGNFKKAAKPAFRAFWALIAVMALLQILVYRAKIVPALRTAEERHPSFPFDNSSWHHSTAPPGQEVVWKFSFCGRGACM